MAPNTQVQSFFQEALSGTVSRREIFKRGAALGLGATMLAALAQASLRGEALASKEGTLTVTYYDWILNLHPPITDVNKDFGKTFPINAQTAPTADFGFDRFVAEAKKQMSTWDMYIGVTPFLEMDQLVASGTIEPWDPYLPQGLLDDLPASIRTEDTSGGKFYVWPFFFDIIVQAWNHDQVAKAGLDPEKAPATWDEFLANAKKVKDSGAAQFGCTYDFHDWRSLIPITHSISTNVYTEDGIFLYTSDAAVAALEIMKQMFELANPDVNQEGTTDGGVNGTPDESVFAAQQACYYVKYQNAPLRFAGTWPDPSKLRLGPLPVKEAGAGGTVFWDTGAVLFKYGQNKQQAANYMNMLTHDQRIWAHSFVGDKAKQETAVGQMPVYKSLWAEWAKTPPDFIAKGATWAPSVWAGLERAKAIDPTIMAVKQFNVARPEWVKYLTGDVKDAKTALTSALNAVFAEWKKETGKTATTVLMPASKPGT